MPRRTPCSSMYWKSSCPGKSWQCLTIFASWRSLTSRSCSLLLLPFGVAPGGLDMSPGQWANPHLLPGWRDADFLDALQFSRVANRLAIEPDIAEVFPHAPTLYARPGIADIAQASRFCRFNGI